MFIQLTKKDGSRIWINSRFIVTVEPLKTGGAVVVPFGDGLDYEVRESAESIIERAVGAPQDELTTAIKEAVLQEAADAPADEPAAPVSEEPAAPAAEEAVPPRPVFDAVPVPDVTEAESAAAVAAFTELMTKPAEEKPAKRTRKAKTRPVPAGTPATEGERKAPRRKASRKTVLELADDQLERIRAMAPRSVKRLSNALSAHFAVKDPESTVRALVEHDIISIDDQSHITWTK